MTQITQHSREALKNRCFTALVSYLANNCCMFWLTRSFVNPTVFTISMSGLSLFFAYHSFLAI